MAKSRKEKTRNDAYSRTITFKKADDDEEKRIRFATIVDSGSGYVHLYWGTDWHDGHSITADTGFSVECAATICELLNEYFANQVLTAVQEEKDEDTSQ